MNHQRRRTGSLAALFACLGVSLFCVAYPMYVIRPFRTQGASELAAALVVMYFRPAVTIISALMALAAAVLYWRVQPIRWRRGLMAAGAVTVCGLAGLARVNVYELMFHPIDRPSFVAAAQAKLDQDEKVVAVKLGEFARAYPVRGLSYHHLVNDTVDSKAIVATY